MRILGKLGLLGAMASIFIVKAQGAAADKPLDEAAGKEYITNLDKTMEKLWHSVEIVNWNYEANITPETEAEQLKVSTDVGKKEKELWEETVTYPWQNYTDENLKRMFKKYAQLGTAALPDDKNEQLIQVVNNMTSSYSAATICAYKNRTKCDLRAEPDVTGIFLNSQDPEELKYTFLEYVKAAGAPNRKYYPKYVELSNEAAKLNGFPNVAEWWLDAYETPGIESQFADLWANIKPLYLQLHAYVRRRLREKYGENIVSAKGPIPSHLLGDIWAQVWGNIAKFTKPYPEKGEIDITSALVAQNYTPVKMFRTAEEFFVSINMGPMPDTFWERSILERPKDNRSMICHPSAWDMFDAEDFRIKSCTNVSYDYFTTCHHEMGHIKYYQEYAFQPAIYRGGANSGFHEAIGDTIALSVTTPKHLKVIGLLEDSPEDEEFNINALYQTALDKVAFLPFAYLIDVYRYGIFRGTTTPEDYNCHFWALRESLQGVEPPAPRTEEDFDAAAKYHVSADYEFMEYFISYNIQFQFHRSLCQIAGQYAPGDSNKLLSNCDIYKSHEAGDALAKMLRMGSSKPWPDAMEVLTGQRKMLADGVLEYFEPLHKWLKAENEKTNEYIGWEPSKVEYCTAEQRERMKESGLNSKLTKS